MPDEPIRDPCLIRYLVLRPRLSIGIKGFLPQPRFAEEASIRHIVETREQETESAGIRSDALRIPSPASSLL